MTSAFIYRSPTTPGNPGWTEDLDDVVRLGRISIGQQAEQGQVNISSILIDDPDATVGHVGDAITGLKQFDWNEDACPVGHRRVFTGYIGARRYRRGTSDSSSLITGPARVIETELYDVNAFLSFRLLGNDPTSAFNRPAETDVQRVLALLSDVDYLSTTLFDGLVSSANPVNMDANDYTDSTPADVLNDCAQQSGKNYFVIYDEAGDYGDTGNLVLFYDINDSTAYRSTTRVSNVAADVDNSTTWYPLMDATLVRDPSRVIAGAKVPYEGGSVYRTRAATAATYGWRDATVSTLGTVKTSAQAIARGDRYLLDNSTEDDRLTFSVMLPKEHVNDVMPGQALQVKFQHLPGYDTTFTYTRVLRRTVSEPDETPDWYTVEYECGGGDGTGGTGITPGGDGGEGDGDTSVGLGPGGGPDSPFYDGEPPCYSDPIAYAGQDTTFTATGGIGVDGAGESVNSVVVPGGFGLKVVSWSIATTIDAGVSTPRASTRGELRCQPSGGGSNNVVGSALSNFVLQTSGGGTFSMPTAMSLIYGIDGAYAPGNAGDNPSAAADRFDQSGTSGDIFRNTTCTTMVVALRGTCAAEVGAAGTWTVTCVVAVVP